MWILKHQTPFSNHNKMESKNNWTTFGSAFAVPSGNKIKWIVDRKWIKTSTFLAKSTSVFWRVGGKGCLRYFSAFFWA